MLSAPLTGLVALIHVYIVVLEMYLWTRPRGLKTFRLTPDFAEKTRVLAANQGLYNGFLVAGLAWGLVHPIAAFATQLRIFFLGCVVVAGIYGGMTSNVRIMYVQAMPAVTALLAVLAGI